MRRENAALREENAALRDDVLKVLIDALEALVKGDPEGLAEKLVGELGWVCLAGDDK